MRAAPAPVVKPALASGIDGGVWVGSCDPLQVVGDTGVATVAGSPSDISCAYRDAGGGLWLGGPEGLWHAALDTLSPAPRFTRVGLPPEVGGGDVQAIALGTDGDLWVSARGTHGKGVYRRRGRAGSSVTWSKVPPPPGQTDALALAIVTDRGGRMWLGYTQSRLVLVAGGSTRVFAPSPPPSRAPTGACGSQPTAASPGSIRRMCAGTRCPRRSSSVP